MSTLTPNRILQKGDQYNDNGAWKPVPKEELGLQIIFSKLKKHELRRPSEKDFPVAGGLTPEGMALKSSGRKPISQDSGEHPSANAESEQVARPVVARGTGERSLVKVIDQYGESTKLVSKAEVERAGLPTVVSKKAHEAPEYHAPPVTPLPPPKPLLRETETEKVVAKAKLIGASSDKTKIKFPGLGAMTYRPIWTGRNGTFNGYGIDLMRLDDRVMVTPIGKRGVGNCLIEFPVTIIPQLIDWLAEQYKGTTKTKSP
jgi:hypothetical protein